MTNVSIDDRMQQADAGELLINVINRLGGKIPQVCYQPQLGPVETCDTCMVEVNGQLVRACATAAADGMKIATHSSRAKAAQEQAFDRILSNHLLYCTVCDNNHGNCTVHNTTNLLAIEHQQIPFRSKPYEVDNTNPFYRYDPDQCILCGPLRRGLPECRGQRNAFHQGLGHGLAANLLLILYRFANK